MFKQTRMLITKKTLVTLAIGGSLAIHFVSPMRIFAQKGLTPAERREMREEGYSPGEINEYNREIIREQQPFSAAERAEMRAEGYSPAEINQLQRETMAEARAERRMDILQSQYDRGLISDAQYERQAQQIEKQSYTQAYGAILGAQMYKYDQEQSADSVYADWTPQTNIDQSQFIAGLQQELAQGTPEQRARLAQIQASQVGGTIGMDQARFTRDYVINGDKPLEAEKGLRPKGNALLPEKPQWLDEQSIANLSKRISLEITGGLSAISDQLPEESKPAGVRKLLEDLKAKGEDADTLSNLRKAIGTLDLRLLETNAELLGVEKQRIAQISLSVAISSLIGKLEQNADTEQVSALCRQVSRFARGANLEEKGLKNVAAWFSGLTDLLVLREQLDGFLKAKPTGEPARPSGQVEVVLDPEQDLGSYRVLPNGWLVCGGRGRTNRLTRASMDARVALGLPAITTKAPPKNNPATTSTHPSAFLVVSGAASLKGAAQYNLRRYKISGASWVVDPVTEAWPSYSIGAGRKQLLPIAEDGAEAFLIEVLPGAGQAAQKFFLAKQRGKNARFEITPSKEGGLTVKPVDEECFLENRSSIPFHYMIGEEHLTVRPFGVEVFKQSVTLRYCPTEKEKNESTLTLKAGERGYVAMTADEQLLVSTNPEWVNDESRFVSAELPTFKHSEQFAEQSRQLVGAPKGSLYVIAVGISSYKGGELSRLNAASLDAKKFVETMQKQKELYKKVDTTLLLDENATAFQIREAITALRGKVTKNDVAIIFFSGHGKMQMDRWYFCPFDATFRKDGKINDKGAISSRELKDEISNILCRQVCVMIDSCFSGGAIDGFKELITEQAESGFTVFASSTKDEESEENAGAGQGVFTKSLLTSFSDKEADADKDGQLAIVELDSAMAEGIKNLTRGRQHFQAGYNNQNGGFKLVRLDEAGG